MPKNEGPRGPKEDVPPTPDNLPIATEEEMRRMHGLFVERRGLKHEFKEATGTSWNKAQKEKAEPQEAAPGISYEAICAAIERGEVASIPESTTPLDERVTFLKQNITALNEEAASFKREQAAQLEAVARPEHYADKIERGFEPVFAELDQLAHLNDEMERREFSLLRERRGKLGAADRGLLAQYEAVRQSVESRIRRLKADPETMIGTRVYELKSYQKGLRENRFAETPSRSKYQDELRRLWEEGKAVLLTGPTGTGKTELLVHLGKKLYGRSPEIIRSSERTGPADIFGKTLLKATPEGGTETFFQPGRYTSAIDAGVPLVIDEFNLLDLKVRFQLKELYNRRPGDEITIQEDTGQRHTIQQGFSFAATANLKSDKYKERFDLDPAESRVFEMRRIDFLPKEELYDLCLAQMLDAEGRLRLSRGDAEVTLKHLVESAEMIQQSFLGAGKFYEEGGGTKKKIAVLEKAVLDPGKVLSMLSGWPAAEARGESFAEYLNEQLIAFINKEDFPEKDRDLLFKILVTKGFFAGHEPADFLVTLKPEQMKTLGLKAQASSPDVHPQPLRASEVATLDPFELRKMELANIANEFLETNYSKVPYKERGKEYKPGDFLKGSDDKIYRYVGLSPEGKPVIEQHRKGAENKVESSREEFEGIENRERESLREFFGKDIDVPPVPISISPERYEKWKSMKFELHYLPPEDMTDSQSYPGWKKKPGTKYTPGKQWGIEFLDEAAQSKNSLTPDALRLGDGWVLIDTRSKPEYQNGNQMYEQDPFGAAIEELRKQKIIGEAGKKGSRFSITWEELQKPEVKAKLAQILEVSPDQIRLPRAIEWNFLGNAYNEQWGTTQTYEWFEEAYQQGRRHLLGGDSGSGGLSDVGWGGAGYRGGNRGFRPLISFS